MNNRFQLYLKKEKQNKTQHNAKQNIDRINVQRVMYRVIFITFVMVVVVYYYYYYDYYYKLNK